MNDESVLRVMLIVQNILALGMVLAVSSALIYLGLAIAGWWGPYRNRRLKRLAMSLAAIPMIVGAQWLLVFTGLEVMAYQQNRQRVERQNASSLVHVGDRAPDFRINDTQGNEFSLAENKGKVILINFFATWCGPCVLELPHIQKIWEAHRYDGDFKLMVIGREETEEAVANFRSQNGYSFPMAADSDRSLYSRFARELIPRNYLIGSDGRICFVSTGFIEPDLTVLSNEISEQLELARKL